jgi:type I restriction enzyme S subunit
MSNSLPSGWEVSNLANVVNLKSGFAYKSQDWVENGVAVIKIANVRNGKVTLDGCSYVTDEVAGETADFEVLDGHLLMTLTGEIGAIGIYKEHRPARLNQRVARIDLKQQGEHFFRYLCLFLESPQARDLMWSKAQGMAQPNISPKEVLQIPFPLAPSDEQVKIVEILEEQLSRLDASLALADSIEKKASALRRSLLYAAFSGDLTKEWREAAYV